MFENEIRQYLHHHGFEAISLKAVLFDMDGVLYDSMPNHAYAWSHAMTQFGLHMTPEEAYMHEGRTGAGTIDILAQRAWGRTATEEEKQHIYKAKTDCFASCPEPQAMPGAYDLLCKVREGGFLPVLVTGSGQPSLLQRLEHSFPGMFALPYMVTGFDVKHGKPHPEPYLMGLQKARINASQAVVVENAPLGVQAAVAAGVFTIAVNTGPLPDSVLLEQGANLLFHSMNELSERWPSVVEALSVVRA